MTVRRGAAALVAATALLAAGCAGSSRPSSSGTADQSAGATSRHSHQAHHVGPTCSLTGAPATKGEHAHRAPLAVKIDNVDQARPQAGLNHADIVVEELVEGGLTRLMAIFGCQSASPVGPIRSARISDADILSLLHGSVLGYSGANPADLPPIEAHADTVLVSNDATPQYFHRDDSRPAPHNVFSSTTTLLHAGLARRHGLHAARPVFTFGTEPGGRKATKLSLSWPAASASWRYRDGHYLRTQNGTADVLAGGGQVTADNVVVLGVNIASSGLDDILGNPSPIDVTTGSNPVWVFRNGREISGTWHRDSPTAPLRLVDKHKHVIRLTPGRTWLELLPRPSHPISR